MELDEKKCVPCEGIGKPLTDEEADKLLEKVPGWTRDGIKIKRKWKFKDFDEAMVFVNKMADIAREEDHHPDFTLYEWNNVTVELWTHAVGGLSENDFIVAAKINRIQQ